MKKKILLCGHNEELHDKIVDEEGSFDKVIKRVEDLKSKKESFNIIIKATKLNFFCLDKIISFAYQLREENKPKKIKFSIVPLRKLLKNFQVFINKNNKILRKDRISIIPDKEILELVNVLKRKANSNNENDLLRLLGIICETTFIGPKQLLIDVKNRCNSDCMFCWIHSPLIRDKMHSMDYYKEPKEINLNTFKRIIDAAASIKVEEIVLVGDGEPTIHERFPEMIEYINKKGLKTMLFSNGLLLNKYFKTIVDNNVTNLELTISAAMQKTYKNLHPSAKKGTLDNIKNSIKELTNYKKKTKKAYPKITIVNVINNKNYNELIIMTKFAKEVGADEVVFKLIDLRDFSMFLKLNGEQIKVVKKDIRKAKELAKEINIEIQDHLDFQLKNINVKTGNWSENVYTKTGCFIGWWFGYYRLDDVFTFCCSIKEVDKLKDKSFREIWFSDDYNKFRIAGKYLSENKNLEFKDGRRLFEPKCNNCDNTDYLNMIQNLLEEYELEKFLFSSKKPRILLTICPPSIIDGPPIALNYLSAYLENKGINHNVLDLNIKVYNRVGKDLKQLWKPTEELFWRDSSFVKKGKKIIKKQIDFCVKEIIKQKINIIGFSVHNANSLFTLEVVKKIKEYDLNIKIIFGGSWCDDEYQIKSTPKKLVDYFIIGDGENKLFNLVSCLIKNKGASYGRVIKKDPKIRKDEEDFFGISKKINEKEYPKTPESFRLIQTTKGCIGSCSFCSDRATKGCLRIRNPRIVLKEIEYYVKKEKIKNFIFADLACNGNLKHLKKICDLIIDSKLKIHWTSFAMFRKEMNYELFQKMKTSGCDLLNFGLESGSDRLLRLMNKITDVKTAEQNLYFAKKARIITYVSFIVGFPGETEEDFKKTIEFIEKNKKNIDYIASINVCYLKKPSELHDNPKKFGIILSSNSDWWLKWEDVYGSNYNLRKERALFLADKVEQLGIKFDRDHLYTLEEYTPKKSCEAKQSITNKKEYKFKDNFKQIALVTLPPWGVNNPPLGLACLSEYLKSKNIEAEVFDFNIQLYNKVKKDYSNLWHVENKNYWSNDNFFNKLLSLFSQEINTAVEKIVNSNANIVAFSVVDPKERLAIEIIKKVKEKRSDIKIIVGGPACATPTSRKFFEERVPELIDAYIVGEGEETLSEVIDKINKNMLLGKVPGVIVFKNSKENNFIPREPLKLEEIPSPTYNDFDLSQYGDVNSLLMEWSRGCIANCSFCIGKLMLGKYRFKEPKKIIKEIKYYIKEKGITNFTIVDNLINGDLKKLEETCDLIIKNKLKISWNCEGIGIEMSISLLKKMKETGCKEFQIGVESGSDVVLRRMRKPYTAKSAELLVRRAKKAGLKTEIFIMIGFPEETESEFNKTLKFIKRNRNYIDLVKSINILHLIAGTDVRDNYKEYGITFPKEKEEGYYKWHTKDSNMEIRNNRVKKVIYLVNKLSIPFLETNIMEGKDKKSDDLRGIDDIITLKLAKDASYDKTKKITKIRKQEIKINALYRKTIAHILKKFLSVKNFFKIDSNINKIEQIRKKLISIPKYVTIDLTNSCNLDCIGCWTHSPLLKDKKATKEWKSQIIPFYILKKLIGDLHDLGTERIRLTGGGEPFLYPKIMEAIRLIKEKEMACDVTTNFMLLTKEKIKQLFELNIDELVVSLWSGDAETYVKTHPNQTEKTFEKIRGNLEFIAQYKEKLRKGPKVIMANVISNINYDKIEEITKFATNVSLDELYFTLIDPIKDRTDSLLLNNKERNILLKKLKTVKKIVEKYNRKSKIHKIGIDDINRFIGKVKSKKANDGKYDIKIVDKPCYIGYIFARILANGDVVPCCRAVMYSMGNINKQSFKKIWFSDEYDKFRERALYESKLSPYFKRIGCFMTCDNQVHNRKIETINL